MMRIIILWIGGLYYSIMDRWADYNIMGIIDILWTSGQNFHIMDRWVEFRLQVGRVLI
jgi:hypothetical protein